MSVKPVDILKHNLPGTILSVCESGAPIRHYCSGFADVKAKVKLSPDRIFQNGKITRTFTAALILKMVEEGLFNLDVPLDSISRQHQLDGGRLRIIVDQYPILKPLTLRGLLNNTSGLPSYDETLRYQRMFFSKPKKVWQAEGYLDLISGVNVRYRLGYRLPVRGFFSDSATNYIVIGLVLEAVNGRPTSKEMQELFEAHHLKDSHYSSHGVLDESLLPQMMHGYLPVSHPHGEAFSGLPILTYNDNRELQVYDVTTAYTANGLAGTATLSNTTDLIHWMKALVGGKILKSSFREMFTVVPVDPRASPREARDFYGLGIYKTLSPHYGEIIWNAGNNYGYGVLVAHLVDRDITFALAVNLNRQVINLHNQELVVEVLDSILRRPPA